MADASYRSNEINVTKSGQGVPEFKAVFERVNVILGENGSGKSRLLHKLIEYAPYFGADIKPVYVETARGRGVGVNTGLDAQNFGYLSTPEQARSWYSQNRRSVMSTRVAQVLPVLKVLGNAAKQGYADAIVAWHEAGQKGPMPKQPTYPMERLLQLCRELIPDAELFETPNNQLYVRKQGTEYPVSTMSDGERQVLAIVADIVIYDEGRSLFLVDEPEMNLHPSLAARLWSLVEETYADSFFVYATHSLSFALRPSVNAVFVLGHEGKVDLSGTDVGQSMRPFLGAIPAILRHHRCVFVEGSDASFDRPFYQWLLGRADVAVEPVGSSTSVRSATQRKHAWTRLMGADVKIGGVIDRDFEGDSSLEGDLIRLEFHEAESYLTDPDLLVRLNGTLKNTVEPLTREKVTEVLVRLARSRLLQVVARRVFAKTSILLRVSFSRSDLKELTSVEDLQKAFCAAASNERSKAALLHDGNALNALVAQEYQHCEAILASVDVERIRMVFEGKAALAELCPRAGCANPLALLTAAREHIEVESVPPLSRLRDELLAIVT